MGSGWRELCCGVVRRTFWAPSKSSVNGCWDPVVWVVLKPLSNSQFVFAVLFTDDGAELCEDRASSEKIEDVEEDADEEIEEVYG